MSKPLTIEELKALEVGDWVWLVRNNQGIYLHKYLYDENEFVTCRLGDCFNYSDYGTKWLAYKNKEQAEMSNEIKRFVEYVGSKIAGHSDYHGDDILSALYCAAEGKEIKDVIPLEAKGKIVKLPCKVGDKVYIVEQLINCGEWVLCNEFFNQEYIVTDILLNINRPAKFKITHRYGTAHLEDFGKTIFTNKEEAEARLQEQRGEK